MMDENIPVPPKEAPVNKTENIHIPKEYPVKEACAKESCSKESLYEELSSDDNILCFSNCYNLVQGENGTWQETGKSILMRWVFPQAMVDLEQEQHDSCVHFFLTVEFSARHYDWNGQRLRFGTNKEEAFRQCLNIVNKIAKWPMFGSSVNL